MKKNLLYFSKYSKDSNPYLVFHLDLCLVEWVTSTTLLNRVTKEGIYDLNISTHALAFMGECTSLTTSHDILGHPYFQILISVIRKFGLVSPIEFTLCF